MPPDDYSQDQGVAADFSFLSQPQQEDDVAAVNRRRVQQLTQQGQMPGQTQAPAQEPPLKQADPNAYLKKRASIYDSIKKESDAAVDRMGAQLQNPNLGFDPEGLRTKLQGSDPLQHATILQQEADKYRNTTLPGGNPALSDEDTDAILNPVEDTISTAKQFLQDNDPQEAAMQAGMAATDLPGVNKGIAAIQNAIQEQRRSLNTAASPRQAARINDKIAFFQQRLQEQQARAAQMEQAVRRGPGVTVADEEAQNAAQQAPESLYGQMVDKKLTFKAVLTSAGWNRPDFIKSNTELWRILQTHGISPDDPVTPATFGIIVPKLVEECFNPQVAQKFFDEISTSPIEDATARKGEPNAMQGGGAPPPPRGETQAAAGGGTTPAGSASDGSQTDQAISQGLTNVNSRIQALQNRHDQIWQELAHSGNFNNVGDVIGFVLTSIVLGPRAGAMLFSNMSRNGALRGELDQINHETQLMYHQQNSYIQLSQHARATALQESRSNSTLQERIAHDKAMEFYLSLRTNRHPDPEVENVKQQKLLGWRIQKDKIDRLTKAATDPFDPEYKKARAAIPAARNEYFAFMNDLAAWAKKNNVPFRSFTNDEIDPFRPKGNTFTFDESE